MTTKTRADIYEELHDNKAFGFKNENVIETWMRSVLILLTKESCVQTVRSEKDGIWIEWEKTGI